jgi:hypothetical protein
MQHWQCAQIEVEPLLHPASQSWALSLHGTPTPCSPGRQWAGNLQASAGRDFEGRRWGPRPLDLDIIFHGSASFISDSLQLPHARWQERDFVKAPLSDLYTSTELSRLADPVAASLSKAQALWADAGGDGTPHSLHPLPFSACSLHEANCTSLLWLCRWNSPFRGDTCAVRPAHADL